ncbi:MAG TPA: efflux RND transporter periplasmic adaptor subunit [Candidatus Dormibacteraeota bacterium]|jgi:membrane fusion protein (multidrug efflux system)|nr:efflux RND transporter periplasmic adaptor subunit [Candidatus Dormibacteraeota bacterium]
MAKRLIIVLLLMAGLIGGLGFIKYRQVESAIAAGASFSIPATSVTTVVAKRETWPSTLSVIGTAAAIEGVTVGADLPGTVDKIHFESGQMVHEGDILVELDIRQERAQLANIEAQRDLAKVQYGRAEELSKAGVISKSEYDNAASQQKATEAQVNEVKASIARKTIHAPFTGVLGLRQISLGQYLAAGQAIVSLQSVNPIYVNFGVPQQDTPKMKIGRSVRVTSTDLPGIGFPGRITALDSVINEQTRNIQIQATLANPGGKLRPGQFLEVELTLDQPRSVIPLPASAINYAPSGDSVFVVGDIKDEKTGKTYKGVRQQIVKIEGSRGDQVAIISGLNPGDEVVSAGAFRLRNAAPVEVNNSVQPSNSAKPNPEES